MKLRFLIEKNVIRLLEFTVGELNFVKRRLGLLCVLGLNLSY